MHNILALWLTILCLDYTTKNLISLMHAIKVREIKFTAMTQVAPTSQHLKQSKRDLRHSITAISPR
jgi:hypothetical protein